MLPVNVAAALSGPVFIRRSANPVDVALARLGVQVSSSFREFYSRYEGPFGSARTGFELLDLCAGDPTVESSTATCRSQHGLTAPFLVLTGLFGGSVLVYGCDDDVVYNMDFEGGERDILAGRLEPQWRSFHEFLAEFFG
jgi:hypothetical protein